MGPLYQCNGLERANTHWHTDRSLSIMIMTMNFLITDTPPIAYRIYTHIYGNIYKYIYIIYIYLYIYIHTNMLS